MFIMIVKYLLHVYTYINNRIMYYTCTYIYMCIYAYIYCDFYIRIFPLLHGCHCQQCQRSIGNTLESTSQPLGTSWGLRAAWEAVLAVDSLVRDASAENSCVWPRRILELRRALVGECFGRLSCQRVDRTIYIYIYYIHTDVHIYTYNVHMYICTYVHIHICIYIYVHLYNKYIYIYTYTYHIISCQLYVVFPIVLVWLPILDQLGGLTPFASSSLMINSSS